MMTMELAHNYGRYPSTGQDRYSSPSRVRYNESVADAPGSAGAVRLSVAHVTMRIDTAPPDTG